MYNTREALAYSGKLPVQQNQAGVTPQLLDLLALQKVDADKKAAAQALAMASGQANMPTVAQGIEQQALNSARGEIAQKLGLAGLAQQQAPQGPAPQQPPAQGLESAPSPLPQTYQEGGIVAFSGATDGSQVEDPYSYGMSEPSAERQARLRERANAVSEDTPATVDPLQAAMAKQSAGVPLSTSEKALIQSALHPARPAPVLPREVSAAARRDDRAPLPSLAGLAAAAAPKTRAPVDRPKAGLAGVAAESAAPTQTAPVAADPNSFTEMMRKRLTGLEALKPEDAYAKGKAEYQTEVGAGLDRDLANQQARIAKREELYARQAAERDPSWLTGLQRMGQNVHALPGQHFQGVSEQISKTNAGYTTQDIANQTAIDTLNDAMEKARQSKDIGGYNAAKGARDAIIAQKNEGGKETATMAGNEMQAASSKYTADSHAKTSMAVARLQEKAADNRLSIQQQQLARQELTQAAASIDNDIKYLEMEKKAYVGQIQTKEVKAELATLTDQIARARALKQQIMGSAYAKQGAEVPAAAPTMSTPPAGAVKKIG